MNAVVWFSAMVKLIHRSSKGAVIILRLLLLGQDPLLRRHASFKNLQQLK